MAKKTRTELSTLAINTNLPDNTTELITPTTERAQLTDERESVVNYKDDFGGATNAGKFLTVAVDGESLTMVDEPSGVPDWVTFVTAAINEMVLKAGGDGTGTSKTFLKFTSYDGSITTVLSFNGLDGAFNILSANSSMSFGTQINLKEGATNRLRIEVGGDLTHWGSIMRLNAQQLFDANPLYTLKFQGRITGPSGGVYVDEEFSNIKGGKENATENNKAGFLSFETAIADGTLSERLRISSGGAAIFSGSVEVKNETAATFARLTIDNTINNYNSEISFKSIYGVTTAKEFRIGSNIGVGSGSWEVYDVTEGETRFSISSGGLATFSNGIKFGTGTTLDAYEEGTFTPTTNGDDTGVLAGKTGEYTRIGNVINFRMVSQITTSFTSYSIGGLPYTIGGSDSVSSITGASIVFNNSQTNIFGRMDANTTVIAFCSNSITTSTLPPTTTMGVLRMSGTYRIN